MPANPEEPALRKFDFYRDTFAFRNELYWEYLVDDAGKVTTRKVDPPPTYAHRCFVVVRSARQFLFHAEFRPGLAKASEAEYRKSIRQVVSRSASHSSDDDERIIFPGYNGLREFSQEQERALKANCGGSWQSYFLRSHWRMLLPISRAHQANEAGKLFAKLQSGRLPIVHIVRFPQLTINHALILLEAKPSAEGIEFTTYDPNLPEAPSRLTYHAATRTFLLPRNIYWAGGRVDLYETYLGGWFY